jgi:peroxiredoxin
VPKPGEKAAVLKAQDINGKTVDTAQQDVVLIFFSTTCQSCINSAHAWREFYERHRDGAISILGVSTEGKDRTRDFVNRFGLAFPVVADPAGRILLGYRVKYLPTVAAVSKKGRFVFYQAHGQDATAALDAAVRALASSF